MSDLSIVYPACVQCGRLCVGTQHYVGALGPLCPHCADTVRQGSVTSPSGLTITPHPADHRIEALEAEVERLTNKLNENSQNFQIECQSAEIGMLRAEVERLREALTECLEYLEPSFFDEELLVLGVVKRARAALAGEGAGS